MEQQGSPASQFFQSPAESLMSAPEDAYTSLFAATTPSAASTVNPMDMLTPKSYNDDSLLPMIKQEEGVVSTPSPSPAPEKKTTKKRKSWGQVLPEPKTNLPPRKRAKTADEKEQRRVERVLRNRRAAQSSRERKRQEVEQLEKRNKDLEAAIQQAEQMNARLMDELAQMRKANGLPPLSQELFSPQTTHQPAETMVSPNATVDPMALSPCLSPVPEESEETLQQEPAKETTLEQSENTSPDLTQRPAAMLSDLQCHMSAEVSKMSQSQSPTTLTLPTLAWLLPLQMTLFSAMALLNFCQRPLTQIVISSKTGISLRPSPQLLTSLIWSLTRPRSPSTTASTTSCTTPSSTTRTTVSRRSSRSQPTTPLRSSATSSASTNLRIKSLRKILSSSPSLARPLLDATLVALRLVSEGRDFMVEDAERETEDSRGQDELVRCLSVITLPSRELLLTLAWAIKHYLEAPIQRETGQVFDSETRSPLRVHQPSKKKAALSVILEEENNRARTL